MLSNIHNTKNEQLWNYLCPGVKGASHNFSQENLQQKSQIWHLSHWNSSDTFNVVCWRDLMQQNIVWMIFKAESFELVPQINLYPGTHIVWYPCVLKAKSGIGCISITVEDNCTKFGMYMEDVVSCDTIT